MKLYPNLYKTVEIFDFSFQYGDDPKATPQVNEDLSRIQEALLRTKKPNGKKHNPGVTCKDILLQNPDSEDGKLNTVNSEISNM